MTARYHQDVVAVAVGILGSLTAVYLAWAAVRGTDDAAPLDLGGMADSLALAVGRQWDDEARIQRLNDPYPLPVRWVAADPDLADSWDALVTLARTGAGWPRSSLEGWAAGPGDLGGSGDQIASVLGKIPTRRLVVLGEPGSGKTMLMVRLVLDLLAGRAQGDPVPVLVPLASWDPANQLLHDWLAARLAVDHPALAPPRSPSGSLSPMHRLLEARLITLVLDGLDEMPEAMRRRALAGINDALRPGELMVVTCRTEEYRRAVLPPAGSGLTVRGAAVLSLQSLDAGTVAEYLRQSDSRAVSGRWKPVLADLGTERPVSQVLITPLMVGLAKVIYNPRSGERADQLPDPAELCQMADKKAVQAHLFGAFIPAAYRYRPDARWQAEEAQSSLAFLARHLEKTIKGPDLAWWQIWLATRRTFERADGFLFWPRDSNAIPSQGLRLSVADLVVDLVTGLMLVLALGLVGFVVYGLADALQIRLASALRLWFVFVLVLCLMTGLTLGLASGLASTPSDLTEAASPAAVLRRDRRATLALALIFGLVFGLMTGLVFALTRAIGAGAGDTIRSYERLNVPGLVLVLVLGLVFGLAVGLWVSRNRTAWLDYMMARFWLADHHQLPWLLMDFLDDAHRRGVLRQVGSMYQFRHIDLQRWLASQSAQHLLPARGKPGEVRAKTQAPGSAQ